MQNFHSDPLDIINVIRKAFALSCLFLYKVSQKMNKDSHIQNSGQTFTKLIQLIGYAVGAAFIARTRRDLFASWDIQLRVTGSELIRTKGNI
jgi:hypothetical protein